MPDIEIEAQSNDVVINVETITSNNEIEVESQGEVINDIGTVALYGPKGDKGDKGDPRKVIGTGLIDSVQDGDIFYITSTTYVHEQAIASTTWVIDHNLNKRPSYQVVDSAYRVQIPDEVEYNSDNQITMYFLSAFSGKAYLN